MTDQEWQNSEIRSRINDGTASDSDFDTLVADKSFDRNRLGPQGQAAYDAAVARLNSQNSTQTEQAPVTEASEPVDDETFIKQARSQFANDNEAYKAALAARGINRGNSAGKVRGIQQAYYDGTIDKGTRDYMMADAIAKFARNTGRDIGNIGAQFTGGAINNKYEEADWNKRNDEMFKQATSSEAATIDNSDKAIERGQQKLNMRGQELANEKANRGLNFSRELQAQAEEAYKKGNKKLGRILSYMASSGATSLSSGQLITLLGSDVLDEAEEAENSDNTLSDFSEDKIREDYTFEDFKKAYPGADENDYNEWVRLIKENPGDYDAKAANAYIDKRMSEIKAAEKAKAKDAKALKKQQKEQEAAAKVKAGYTNSYNNIMSDLNNGNKSSLTRAYNNFVGGRNPFDKNSFIDNKAMSSITEQAKKILADNGQNWLNQNGTPSDEYMATVLKLALDSL